MQARCEMGYLDALGGVDMWHGVGPVGRQSHHRRVGLEHRRRKLAVQHVAVREANTAKPTQTNHGPICGEKHGSVATSRCGGSKTKKKRGAHRRGVTLSYKRTSSRYDTT